MASDNNEAENSPSNTSAPIESESDESKRTRRKRLFPNKSFEESMFLADAIQAHASGQEVRRLTLFETLNRSPDSGPTRKLITASNQYGITTGSYKAEVLALTDLGKTATDPSVPELNKDKARFELAILQIGPFNAIFDKYAGGRLPQISVLRDTALAAGVNASDTAECVETFLANARYVGLIRSIAGTEHLVTIDDALDQLPRGETASSVDEPDASVTASATGSNTGEAIHEPRVTSVSLVNDLDDVCFVISPIGSEDSEERKHANLILGSLIEPAIENLQLRAIRADKISKPGLITGQVLDHLTRAKIVIADLSFGNPNVYYELALRQVLRKPLVQITRSSDKLPFDVGQFRTVVIDMNNIYTLVPALDLHRQEISRQCRAALEDGETAENPISRFYPRFWDYLPKAPE